jgi:prolyl oligopeptidase
VVFDPYRALEDPDAPATAAFVAAQNECSRAWFSSSEAAAAGEGVAEVVSAFAEKMTALYNYEKFGTPFRRGGLGGKGGAEKYEKKEKNDDETLFFFHNDGLQNQYVLKCHPAGADPATARVLLDPNALREDGTAALRAYDVSPDAGYLAYGVSYGGSDWFTVYVRDVRTGEDLEGETIEWCKFSDIEWTTDSTGFYYARYAKPESLGSGDAQGAAGTETDAAENQMIYFHKVGTPVAQDRLVYKTPEHPKWMFGTSVSDDGRFLLVTTNDSCDPVNRLYMRDLHREAASGGDAPMIKAVDNLDAMWSYVTNDGDDFVFMTNRDAPRCMVVRVAGLGGANDEATARACFSKTSVQVLVPESATDVLESVQVVCEGVLVAKYLRDCKNVIVLLRLADGKVIAEVEMPFIGSVLAITGRRQDPSIFFKVVSFLSPGTTFQLDLRGALQVAAAGSGTSSNNAVSAWNSSPTLFRQVDVGTGFDPSKFVVKQLFATSKDGTRVPMFVVHKKGLSTPSSCLLYGYGGFNISLTPGFSTFRLPFIEAGGVYVMSNLRGGGEYGDDWHYQGTVPKGRKQNVFDDFIACAEALIAQGYTTSERICIQGGSNGGLLVAACCNQRPDLFAAGVAQVGVMDMLRFHKFTIGYAWCSDYGNADESAEDFAQLIKISPVHNVRVPPPGVQFPAMLVTTGDHDDRVVPLHSMKLLAELQHTVASRDDQHNPVIARITVNEGHGAGKPTKKIIAEQADIYAFVLTTTQGRLGGAGEKPRRSPRRPSLLHPPPKHLAGL